MTFHALLDVLLRRLGYDYCMDSLPEPITVSSSVLSQMFLYLASLKVDIDGFLRSLGVEPADVSTPDACIPVDTYLLIQDEAAHIVRDPYFGLHMGEFVEAGSWSILGYLMMNCKTLGEAFEKWGRYSRIIGNLIDGRVEWRFNKIRVVFFPRAHAPKLSRHCFESTFSSIVRMMRSLTGAPLSPLKVTFVYPEPDMMAEYERIFCCPVLFGQKENSITIDLGMLKAPVRLANPGLREQFEIYAQDFLAEMERKDETTRSVTKIVLARLDDETLSIEKIAREMSISVRTLQKRLEGEGVVFSDLLKDIRQRLARRYLRECYSVEEITYMLGFSEPSVFRKAFKKWSGVTPGEYRQRSVSV
jgi:AraC-like DNA-binding protein